MWGKFGKREQNDDEYESLKKVRSQTMVVKKSLFTQQKKLHKTTKQQ